MNDYEEEKKALLNWCMGELDRIARECPYTGGLDGEETVQGRLMTQEYNRRLLALKAKYNRA